MIKRFILPILLLALVSCKGTDDGQVSSVGYVDDIIAGGISLPAFESDGAIYIIGEEDRCKEYAALFLSEDSRENVDGSVTGDGLADFCGEHFCVLYDEIATPYLGFLPVRQDELREEVVKDAILATDSLSHLSPFDTEGNIKKPVAKVILLANSLTAPNGLGDVARLFELTGCDIPVFSPIATMVDEALDDAGSTGVMAGIFAENGLASTGVYSLYFRRRAKEFGLTASDCVAYEPKSENEPLKSFLDSYIAAGYTTPLDVMIVDNFSVDPKALEEEYISLTSVMNENSLVYKKYLSEGMRFIDCRQTAVKLVFNLLRKRNGFTHNITYPYVTEYYTAISSAEDGKKIIIEKK